MSESTLKRSDNRFRAVGTVYEKNFKLDDGKAKLYKDGRPTGEEVPCKVIYGNFSIRTEDGVLTFNTYFSSVGRDGGEAKTWAMAQSMMDKWEPEVNGAGEEPTKVSVTGDVAVNDYLTQSGEINTSLRWNVRSANTRVKPEEETGCTLSITAFIRSIADEIKDDEETGRLKVSLLAANSNGALIPIKCIVEEDIADDFKDMFSVGDTAEFDINRTISSPVSEPKKKKALGRGAKIDTTQKARETTELVIVGADSPIEEPEELTYEDDEGNVHEIETKWMNPKAVKAAIKVREAMLEELKKNPPKKSSKPTSFAQAKAEAKKTVGKKKPVVDDAPFDDDDIDELF